MKHIRTMLVVSLLAGVCGGASAWADVLILKDGRTFEGSVARNKQIFTVNSEGRWFQFSADLVAEHNGRPIEPRPEGTNPLVKIATDQGDILVELFEDQAPNTVANMITLADRGFYKGMSFHRIIPGFMVQGGCPHSKEGAAGVPGTGGPGYRFADEISTNLKHNVRGIVSMANSGPGTNGSQFFICFREAPHLDGKHTVFGKVIGGLDVLDKLEDIGSPSGKPSETVRFTIDVVSKRDHDYTVEKL